jgi:hypothetical protein
MWNVKAEVVPVITGTTASIQNHSDITWAT